MLLPCSSGAAAVGAVEEVGAEDAVEEAGAEDAVEEAGAEDADEEVGAEEADEGADEADEEEGAADGDEEEDEQAGRPTAATAAQIVTTVRVTHGVLESLLIADLTLGSGEHRRRGAMPL
jgi:hypothetical protein